MMTVPAGADADPDQWHAEIEPDGVPNQPTRSVWKPRETFGTAKKQKYDF